MERLFEMLIWSEWLAKTLDRRDTVSSSDDEEAALIRNQQTTDQTKG